MAIHPLKSPLNEPTGKTGPITNTFYGQHKLTDEEIRLYEKLAPLPKPKRQPKPKKPETKTLFELMPTKEQLYFRPADPTASQAFESDPE